MPERICLAAWPLSLPSKPSLVHMWCANRCAFCRGSVCVRAGCAITMHTIRAKSACQEFLSERVCAPILLAVYLPRHRLCAGRPDRPNFASADKGAACLQVVVRCEDINISGGIVRQKMKYERFLRKGTRTNPLKGQFHFRAPAAILRRTIRGYASLT
jgi:hypothetical protein